jgi:hypothetical protein
MHVSKKHKEPPSVDESKGRGKVLSAENPNYLIPMSVSSFLLFLFFLSPEHAKHPLAPSSLPSTRSLHPSQNPRLRNFCHVNEDIIRRVTVQRCAEPLLVKMVTNESNATTENEQPVERPDLDVLARLFWGEGAAVPEEIDEADGDAAVDV